MTTEILEEVSEAKEIDGVIYKATSIANGKVYIGLTTLGLEKRKKTHFGNANNDRLPDTYFYRALKKYGEDGFCWEIIDTSKNSKELNEKEIYWIDFYNSFGEGGYNLTKGGEGTSGRRKPEYLKKANKIRKPRYVASSSKGENQHRSILTNDCVYKIRDLIIKGELKASEIASLFGVEAGAIRLIQNGWNWRHIISDEDVVKMKASSKRLCVEDVIEIKNLLIEGIKTIKEIAVMFNASESVVDSIKKGANWKSVITKEDVKKMNNKNIKRISETKRNLYISIKNLLLEGLLSQREIALRLKVNDSIVSSVKFGDKGSNLFTEEELKRMRGNESGYTKLTDEMLSEIKLLLLKGDIQQKEIAKRYNISISKVSNINTEGRIKTYKTPS